MPVSNSDTALRGRPVRFTRWTSLSAATVGSSSSSHRPCVLSRRSGCGYPAVAGHIREQDGRRPVGPLEIVEDEYQSGVTCGLAKRGPQHREQRESLRRARFQTVGRRRPLQRLAQFGPGLCRAADQLIDHEPPLRPTSRRSYSASCAAWRRPWVGGGSVTSGWDRYLRHQPNLISATTLDQRFKRLLGVFVLDWPTSRR